MISARPGSRRRRACRAHRSSAGRRASQRASHATSLSATPASERAAGERAASARRARRRDANRAASAWRMVGWSLVVNAGRLPATSRSYRPRRSLEYPSIIVKLRDNARFRHGLHPRRPGTRPVDRRDHHADLSDLDLRAGGARPPQGLRVRAHAEPDAERARGQPRGHRERQSRRSRLPQAWPPRAPS